MSLKDQDKLEDLRRRLYERDYKQKPLKRHRLSDIKQPAKENQGNETVGEAAATVGSAELASTQADAQSKVPPEKLQTATSLATAELPQTSLPAPSPERESGDALELPEAASAKAATETDLSPEVNVESNSGTPDTMREMTPRRRKKKYRFKLLLGGVIFFSVAVLAAIFFLLTDNNNIDGKNITIKLIGPPAVRGGETLLVDVAITNKNPVAIESAILIVEYPVGSQSVTEIGKEIFNDRFSLETINPGETITVPLKALVVGEENEEKEIKVEIDYRIKDSNSTFYKDAEPLKFKINSSPVVLTLEGIKAMSSGQEYEATLTVELNATSPLTNVLVNAEYPSGFDFTEANPKPVSANNIWSIDKLTPGEEHKITLKGLLIGEEKSEQTFTFSLGLASSRNPSVFASALTKISNSVLIEQPFLALDVTINNSSENVVAILAGDLVETEIKFTNTVSDALFDTVVKVSLGGSGLSERDVSVTEGFYDSGTNIITYDKNTAPALEEIIPGGSERVTFSLRDLGNTNRTQQINITIDVSSERVFEDNLSEELIGGVVRLVKVSSNATLRSSNEYYPSVFKNQGPVPPAAEHTTTYTIALATQNTTNDLIDAVTTMKLPPYVTWQDVVRQGDNVTYNERDRIVSWRIGSLPARSEVTTAFQVALVPSQTQIGDTPVLVDRQQFRATDNFTGTVVRTSAPPISTELPTESGFAEDNGRVLSEPTPTKNRRLIDETGRVIEDQ